MATLTSKQRAHLRRLAHALKPLVLVGAEGVTPAVVRAVEDAFNTRELLKIKALEAAPAPIRVIADQVVEEVEGVHPVHIIGRTAVLYRRHPQRPEIVLPGGG
jgi:RNA-binding protein